MLIPNVASGDPITAELQNELIDTCNAVRRAAGAGDGTLSLAGGTLSASFPTESKVVSLLGKSYRCQNTEATDLKIGMFVAVTMSFQSDFNETIYTDNDVFLDVAHHKISGSPTADNSVFGVVSDHMGTVGRKVEGQVVLSGLAFARVKDHDDYDSSLPRGGVFVPNSIGYADDGIGLVVNYRTGIDIIALESGTAERWALVRIGPYHINRLAQCGSVDDVNDQCDWQLSEYDGTNVGPTYTSYIVG